MKKLILLVVFVMSFAAINAAAAPGTNLVTNGGFETGDFTGWTKHTCGSECGAQGWYAEDFGAYTGSYSAANACVAAPCNDPVSGDWIKQTLATDPSQLYSITFAYDAGEESGIDGTTQLNVYWNGALIRSLVNIPEGYHVYTITGLTPGSSGTTLEFTARQDPATLYLDAIDVEATGPGSYIGGYYYSFAPETCPSTLTATCAVNSTTGPVHAPVFVFVNNSSTAITGGVFAQTGGDSFQVGTIAGNSRVIVIPCSAIQALFTTPPNWAPMRTPLSLRSRGNRAGRSCSR
jgi:hypothetical protein